MISSVKKSTFYQKNTHKTSEKLLKIQADHQKVQNNAINLVRNKGGGKAAPNAINIQNAVFAGTTSDLLKLIKSTQEKQIIEMDKNDDE